MNYGYGHHTHTCEHVFIIYNDNHLPLTEHGFSAPHVEVHGGSVWEEFPVSLQPSHLLHVLDLCLQALSLTGRRGAARKQNNSQVE